MRGGSRRRVADATTQNCKIISKQIQTPQFLASLVVADAQSLANPRPAWLIGVRKP
jgi:hypothetical protein